MMTNLNLNNNLLRQFFNNPLFNQAQRMAQGKTPQEIEQIARNLCAEKDLNYEEALSAFQNYMKGIM